MKMHAWLLAGLLASGAVLADGADPQAAPADAATGADVAEAPVTLPAGKGENWPFSYTMGYSLGGRVHGDIPELDLEAFIDAFRQGFAGAPGQLDEAQMKLAITQFNEARMAKMKAARDKLAADNLAKSNEFLAKNGKRKGVKTTKSGLQYEVVKKGAGPAPQPTDMVTAHYHGTLPDGTVFDSSREGDPVDFPLAGVIPGWIEGLQLMSKGAQFKLYIPSQLAYGERGAGEAIGPNQALVFEVELVDFKPSPQPVPAGEPTE